MKIAAAYGGAVIKINIYIRYKFLQRLLFDKNNQFITTKRVILLYL